MARALTLILVAAVGVFAAVPAFLAQSRESGRLFYEMVVTNAGTRSAGWNGTLYDANGAAIEIAPGATVETEIGTFAMHACTTPWTPCGMLRQGVPPQDAPSIDVLTDTRAWEFRLYVIAEGSRSQGWRGELRHGDELVPPAGDAVETIMGRFVPQGDGEFLWDWSGWAPDGWTGQ